MLSFSVIIPCYRDEDKLAYLLYQLHQLPRGPEEIIVIDGADSERCREICNQYSVHWLTSEPCRGEQLRAGAALAKGEVLWFLHADARFSKESLGAMTSALEQGAVGGYFRFRFDVPRTWPALILNQQLRYVVAMVFPMVIRVFLCCGKFIRKRGAWSLAFI